jgi:hypothetical protein
LVDPKWKAWKAEQDTAAANPLVPTSTYSDEYLQAAKNMQLDPSDPKMQALGEKGGLDTAPKTKLLEAEPTPEPPKYLDNQTVLGEGWRTTKNRLGGFTSTEPNAVTKETNKWLTEAENAWKSTIYPEAPKLEAGTAAARGVNLANDPNRISHVLDFTGKETGTAPVNNSLPGMVRDNNNIPVGDTLQGPVSQTAANLNKGMNYAQSHMDPLDLAASPYNPNIVADSNTTYLAQVLRELQQTSPSRRADVAVDKMGNFNGIPDAKGLLVHELARNASAFSPGTDLEELAKSVDIPELTKKMQVIAAARDRTGESLPVQLKDLQRGSSPALVDSVGQSWLNSPLYKTGLYAKGLNQEAIAKWIDQSIHTPDGIRDLGKYLDMAPDKMRAAILADTVSGLSASRNQGREDTSRK